MGLQLGETERGSACCGIIRESRVGERLLRQHLGKQSGGAPFAEAPGRALIGDVCCMPVLARFQLEPSGAHIFRAGFIDSRFIHNKGGRFWRSIKYGTGSFHFFRKEAFARAVRS